MEGRQRHWKNKTNYRLKPKADAPARVVSSLHFLCTSISLIYPLYRLFCTLRKTVSVAVVRIGGLLVLLLLPPQFQLTERPHRPLPHYCQVVAAPKTPPLPRLPLPRRAGLLSPSLAAAVERPPLPPAAPAAPPAACLRRRARGSCAWPSRNQ